jgi:hypothetical protein
MQYDVQEHILQHMANPITSKSHVA